MTASASSGFKTHLISGADDQTVLDWAADENRIVLTHDFATLINQAYERTSRGQTMPGVFVVQSQSSPGPIIADLELLARVSEPGEYEGQVLYIPL